MYQSHGIVRTAKYYLDDDSLSIDFGDRQIGADIKTYAPAQAVGKSSSGDIRATTEGLVLDVLVSAGDAVDKGQTLVIVEAMKMEHRFVADGDGIVSTVNAQKGQQVKNRQLLIEINLAGDES